MRIKRVELVGFKSFCDGERVDFQNRITGVVGPNGCGKSNIVDALRWAMGEQSARHLRGKTMEDVIFNGSDSRGPSGMGEVTVVFENDGRMPVEYLDYSEIAVTRKLHRDGTSEYLINKVPVRLMDITNIFLGTGVGTKAYSIVEQGRIGIIVSSRPEDRRHFIEEAAGITKYQRSKKTAERRMDRTRQNLLRVSDVLEEIGKRLSSLRRQAKKAERYKVYREEMREIELWSAAHRMLEQMAEEKFLAAKLDDLRRRHDVVQADQEKGETELETARITILDEEQKVNESQEQLYTLDNRVKLNEQNIQFQNQESDALEQRAAEERDEVKDLRAQVSDSQSDLNHTREEVQILTRRRAAMGEELGTREERLDDLKAELIQVRELLEQEKREVTSSERTVTQNDAHVRAMQQRRKDVLERLDSRREEMGRVADRTRELSDTARILEGELETLRENVENLSQRRRDIKLRIEEAGADAQRGEAKLEVLRDELHRRNAKLESLKEFERKYEGFSRGTKEVMKRLNGGAGAEGVQGLVADKVEAAGMYETALEAVLGQRLGTIIVDNDTVGPAAIEYLKANAKGRSTFINRWSSHASIFERAPVGFVWEPGGAPGATAAGPGGEALQSAEGVHGPMLQLIAFDREFVQVAESLLGDVVVVEDLKSALGLWEGLDAKTLVTLDGEILGPDGTLTGGSIDAELAGVLRKKREIKEQTAIIADMEAQFKKALDRHLSLKTELAGLEQALERSTHESHQEDKEILTRDKDLSRITLEMETLSARQSELVSEKGKMRNLVDEMDLQEATLSQETADCLSRMQLASDMVYLLSREDRRMGALGEEASAEVTDARVGLAQVEAQCWSMEENIRRIEEVIGERGDRIQRLEESAAADDHRAVELRGQAQQLQEELQDLVTRRAAKKDELEARRTTYDALQGELGEQDLALKSVRNELAALTKEIGGLDIRLSELALNKRHLEEQVRERPDSVNVELKSVLTDYHLRAPVTEEQLERLAKLRHLLDRMGPVNLTAIDEFGELSERYEFLSTQRDDLEGALTQLQRAIQKINHTSRRRFKDTFDLVNNKFQEIFPRLFNGGRARLTLTEPDNLLETGVEIVAQPPGKKLQSIDLLSGGEKALTAVSLIFSMFMVKPTPFCLLDEVDAPLDEANVVRFGEIVKEMSSNSQFIIITHNRRTMEIADRLYGVTMEEPGISKLVSVSLDEGQSFVDE